MFNSNSIFQHILRIHPNFVATLWHFSLIPNSNSQTAVIEFIRQRKTVYFQYKECTYRQKGNSMTVVKKLIYIVGGTADIIESLRTVPGSDGFAVRAFPNGQSAFLSFHETAPDMLIIDICAFGSDERALCSSLRQKSSIPIILISARNAEADIIAGIASGCDDYLVRPFSPIMLIARIKALFRRVELDKAAVFADNITRISDITLDRVNSQAFIGEKSVFLTAMEFNLLLYLTDNKSRPVSRRELLDKVWGFENEVETRAPDDMMKRIRKKLKDADAALKIETVRGFGFRIK
jgi:two-component system, OmpR family, response regulator